MSALHYRSYFVPAANQVAANVALALLFNSLGYGDDPAVSPSCGNAAVPASGPDDAAATYYYGGRPADDAMIAGLNAIGTTIPLPTGFSWPVTGVGGASVSEVEALAAAATIFYDTQTTVDGTAPNSVTSKVAAMTALGLKDQIIGGGGL